MYACGDKIDLAQPRLVKSGDQFRQIGAGELLRSANLRTAPE
jgi:hypothetical protein